jgi:hypothetical protein
MPSVRKDKLTNTQETGVQKQYQSPTRTALDRQKVLDTTSFPFARGRTPLSIRP